MVNDYSINKFREYLLQSNWELVTQSNDVNSAYDVFLKSMDYKRSIKVIDKKAETLREVSKKEKTNRNEIQKKF